VQTSNARSVVVKLLSQIYSSSSGVPNLGYMYPQGYICLFEGVHLRLAIEERNIFTYHFFPNIYTYISEWYIQKSLYAYCQMHLWIIMTKYFVMRNFRGTCSSVEMLKGYMVVCWNAEGVHAHLSNAKGVHRKRKVGNPWSSAMSSRHKAFVAVCKSSERWKHLEVFAAQIGLNIALLLEIKF